MTASELLDINELAARWNVTTAVVYSMRYRRNAPAAFRVGRRLMFRRIDVEQWEAAQALDDQRR